MGPATVRAEVADWRRKTGPVVTPQPRVHTYSSFVAAMFRTTSFWGKARLLPTRDVEDVNVSADGVFTAYHPLPMLPPLVQTFAAMVREPTVCVGLTVPVHVAVQGLGESAVTVVVPETPVPEICMPMTMRPEATAVTDNAALLMEPVNEAVPNAEIVVPAGNVDPVSSVPTRKVHVVHAVTNKIPFAVREPVKEVWVAAPPKAAAGYVRVAAQAGPPTGMLPAFVENEGADEYKQIVFDVVSPCRA